MQQPFIAIDYGHGGSDPGAGGNGLVEKVLTRQIGEKVVAGLIRSGFRVLVIREGDVYVGLSERARRANAAGVNYMLSIHINAGGGTGFESYVQLGNDAGETARIRSVVHAVVASYFSSNGLSDRGKKTADLAVCRETSMPACLIECGFIDRSEDAAKLADSAFIDGLAESIVRGICQAFNVSYAVPAPSSPPVQITQPDWIGHPFQNAIEEVMREGLMFGYDDLHFGPNDTLKRGELAVVLTRLWEKLK